MSFSRSRLFMPVHSVLFLHNTYLYIMYNSSITTPRVLFVSKKFVIRLSRRVNLFLKSTLQNHGSFTTHQWWYTKAHNFLFAYLRLLFIPLFHVTESRFYQNESIRHCCNLTFPLWLLKNKLVFNICLNRLQTFRFAQSKTIYVWVLLFYSRVYIEQSIVKITCSNTISTTNNILQVLNCYLNNCISERTVIWKPYKKLLFYNL